MKTNLVYVGNYFEGLKPSNIYTQVSKLKKLGREPKWLERESSKIAYIDINGLEKYMTLDNRAKDYANTSLYWLFIALGYSNFSLSGLMAEKSNYFTSKYSWGYFFSVTLWSYPETVMFNTIDEPSMLSEFIRIGTKHIYLLNKAGKFKVKNEEVFSVSKEVPKM